MELSVCFIKSTLNLFSTYCGVFHSLYYSFLGLCVLVLVLMLEYLILYSNTEVHIGRNTLFHGDNFYTFILLSEPSVRARGWGA